MSLEYPSTKYTMRGNYQFAIGVEFIIASRVTDVQCKFIHHIYRCKKYQKVSKDTRLNHEVLYVGNTVLVCLYTGTCVITMIKLI